MNITLTLSEVVSLFIELNGDGKDFEGILKKELTPKQKSILGRLERFVAKEVESYEKIRKELFVKHGDEPDKNGNITVPPANIQAFQNDYNELMGTEVPLSLSTLWTTPLTLDDLNNIKTKEYYKVLTKILDNE